MPSEFVDGPPLPESPGLGTEHLEKTRKDLETQQRGELRADIQFLLTNPQGRRFLWRLLERAQIYASGMRESHAAMAYEAGLKDMGMWLIGQLEAVDPHGYAKLLVDSANDRMTDKLLLQHALEQRQREGLGDVP